MGVVNRTGVSSPFIARAWLMGLTVVGVVMGWVFLFSASYPISAAQWGDAFTVAGRQLRFLAGAVLLFALAVFIPLRRLGWGALLVHLFVLLLLILTLRFGVSVGGVVRWLTIGDFRWQPSEFAKVTLVLALAFVMGRWWTSHRWSQKGLWWLLGVGMWLSTVALVLLQPHLSGGIILAGIGAATLLFARIPLPLWLATLIGVGAIGYGTRYAILHPYQQRRWQTAHAFSWGGERRWHYQSRQATLALGVGGWFGRGLFQGRQKAFSGSAKIFVFALCPQRFCLRCHRRRVGLFGERRSPRLFHPADLLGVAGGCQLPRPVPFGHRWRIGLLSLVSSDVAHCRQCRFASADGHPVALCQCGRFIALEHPFGDGVVGQCRPTIGARRAGEGDGRCCG